MFIDYEAIVLSPYGLNLAIVCVYFIRIRSLVIGKPGSLHEVGDVLPAICRNNWALVHRIFIAHCYALISNGVCVAATYSIHMTRFADSEEKAIIVTHGVLIP